MGKEIAKSGPSLPAEYLGPDGLPIGTEGIKPDDLLLPRIRIVQPTSLDYDEGLGKLKNSITGEVYEKLSIVPLSVTRGMVLFPSGETHSGPECKSLDGVVSTDGKLCAECEHSKGWTEEHPDPPDCAELRNFPCLLPDGSLAALSFKRASITVAKQLITVIAFKKTPFFFWQVDLTTEKAEGTKGVYYIPKIAGKLKETSEDTRKIALEWIKRLQEKGIDVDYEPTSKE